MPIAPLRGSVQFPHGELVHGCGSIAQTPGATAGWGAAAHVDISALNDSLVFCCVFLRGCMPDQTAFLGLHPIFIL